MGCCRRTFSRLRLLLVFADYSDNYFFVSLYSIEYQRERMLQFLYWINKIFLVHSLCIWVRKRNVEWCCFWRNCCRVLSQRSQRLVKTLYWWSNTSQMQTNGSIVNSRNVFILLDFLCQGWHSGESTRLLAPTNVARDRFPDPASYLGWICWFSTLHAHREVFLRVIRFSPGLLKPNIWFDLR